MTDFLRKHIHFKHRPRYFSRHTGKEINEIFLQTMIASLSLSFIFIFEPIYLYTLGYSPVRILWFYVFVYIFYILFMPFGAKIASRMGYKHSILISNFFYVLYWVALFSVRQFDVLYFIAPIFFALQKAFFWPAYNADIAVSNNDQQRGREVGVLMSVNQLAFVVGPVLGGFISEMFGFVILFSLAAILMIASAYPLFRSKEIYSEHDFTFKKFFQVFRENKQNFFGYWGYAEDMMVMSLWPVFMFIVIPELSKVGGITTIATLIGTVTMLYIGKLADKYGNRKLIQYSSVLYGFSWILRFLGISALGVLFFDIITRISRAIFGVPLLSLSYARADGRSRDYAIAYGVFYEFSVSVGKLLTCFGGILILHFTGSIVLTFVLAGFLTMFYSLLK